MLLVVNTLLVVVVWTKMFSLTMIIKFRFHFDNHLASAVAKKFSKQTADFSQKASFPATGSVFVIPILFHASKTHRTIATFNPQDYHTIDIDSHSPYHQRHDRRILCITREGDFLSDSQSDFGQTCYPKLAKEKTTTIHDKSKDVGFGFKGCLMMAVQCWYSDCTIARHGKLNCWLP